MFRNNDGIKTIITIMETWRMNMSASQDIIAEKEIHLLSGIQKSV